MLKKVFMCFVALLAMAFALPASAMQIYVHYGNGTWPSGTTSLNGSGNLTLEVEASDSFENLKAKIEDKSGLTPAHITLSYGTYDNLPNDGTLYQYGITSGGTTLTMTYNPPKYTAHWAEGTEDVEHWSISPAEATTTGVAQGTAVTATYNGTQKVKSVKAVKYVPPAATVTTAPTATEGLIEANSTADLVNAGAANGGTMMYAVTTTNVQPASTADFSATRPTAEGRTAGTYYVWYYAKADADHSDSEIAGPVSVTLVVITTVTWNSSNISNLSVMGTFQSYTMEGITLSANANQNYAEWMDFGEESMNGITFQANESGGYTFMAPTGKKFIKIEMTPNNSGGWDNASLGTGWAYAGDSDPMTMDMICTVTWKGSAASTVGLLTGANNFGGESVKSIVFTLIDAQ